MVPGIPRLVENKRMRRCVSSALLVVAKFDFSGVASSYLAVRHSFVQDICS